MSKKPSDRDAAESAALTHNPFAKLARPVQPASAQAQASAKPATVSREPPSTPWRRSSVRMHLETKGRSGKVVTRISGLPKPNLTAIASRIQKALGCSATVEGDDLLLGGSLLDRASGWIDKTGDLRTISEPASHPPAPASAQPGSKAPSSPASTAGADAVSAPGAIGSAAGTRRSDVRPGQRVAIVLKADQETGKLTEGIVRELLTNSPVHPRGIKVRLVSGEVGRVKVVY